MWKRGVSGVIVVILVLGIFGLTFEIQPAKANTITVPDDYATIQEAINNANEGDTIYARAGVYYGDFVVNQRLSLVGENKETTIIVSNSTVIHDPNDPTVFVGRDTVSIKADGVSISGFAVNGNGTYGWGITIRGSNCVVKDNEVFGIDGEGIFLDGRANNVEGNLVINNTLRDNKGCGLLAWGANKNCIRSNTVFEDYFGIYLYGESNENMIAHNDIHNNTDIGVGIIWHSNNNSIIDNNISGNGQHSNESYASGICSQTYSQSNHIINNELSSNKRGYCEYYSAGQIIYHNSFINNSQQFVIDSQLRPNTLDNGYPSGGNYWSDYTGLDANSDGIGDTSYTIDASNQDRYPLMIPWKPLQGDINYDGAVDILDIVAITSIYGCKAGELKWNPQTDLAPPYGKIDILDMVTCTTHYGQKYP